MRRSFILAFLGAALPATAHAQHDLVGGVLVLVGAVAGLLLGMWLGSGRIPMIYVLAVWLFAVLVFYIVPELLGGIAYGLLPLVYPMKGAITLFLPTYLVARLLSRNWPNRKRRE